MLFRSTRGHEQAVSASEAILQGLAPDGGLYVPDEIPALTHSMDEFASMSYQEVAYHVLKLLLTDFTEEELKSCISKAYGSQWDDATIAPIHKVGEVFHLELFHGPTIAFKDIALTILPHLLTTSARKHGIKNEIVILTATSGDTGKAALAGFTDVEGTRIIVFYPKGGVSKIQELQMTTQVGDNVHVVAIHGNFDEAQNGVKQIFHDQELAQELEAQGFQLSSANSINIGRLAPQIVYYVYSYAKLLAQGELKQGELLHVTVPTGNFGNILAAYYAKCMGVPIGKLICASNENKVLFDFFQTGVYDRNRPFVLTSSPSMDILISSNLERLIYTIAESESDVNASLMKNLTETGSYMINESMREHLHGFVGGYASEEQTWQTIRTVYEETGYVMDTHTAVASYVNQQFREQHGDVNTLVVSTASPYKFIKQVMCAIDSKYNSYEELDLISSLYEVSKVSIPKAVQDVIAADVIHTTECASTEMKQMVKDLLQI